MRDVVVVLDNIRSLYNVGSFFRTADGAGVKKIICTGITGTPDNHKLWKVSLGSEKTIDWRYYEDIEFPLQGLRNQGYQIVGVEKNDQSQLYTEVEYSDKVALVMGAEVDGVSDEGLELCDTIAHLPMRGEKNSLNVAVAGGVMIYHLLK